MTNASVASAHRLHRRLCVGLALVILVAGTGVITSEAAAEPRYLESGIDNFNFNQLDAAMYEFKKAVELKPNNPVVHYYMASVLSRQNKMEEARDEYRKALSLAVPSSPLAQLCRVAIANIDKQLPVSAGRNEANSLLKSGQKNETTSEPKQPKLEKKPTAARKPSTEDDDPDVALLKATGGLPPPLLQDELLGAKKEESLESLEPLRAKEVETECQAIQAAAHKRIIKMQSAKVRGENGDIQIYSGEDYEDVQQEADAMCAKLRSQLDKKPLTVPDKKGRK